MHDWRFLARPEQLSPAGDWDIWLLLAGRGFGKTRTGAEWVRQIVDNNEAGRIALIAETAADARDVMVAELLRIFPPGQTPEYQKSNRRVTFHNGAVAFTYNATEPDQLRGPQHDAGWLDEIAKWRYARETFDQFQFGLRLGDHPRQVITTTPRPIQLIKDLLGGQEGKVHVTRGHTFDNRSNLAGRFLDRIQARYAGTRLGRQELAAELLGDLPGALWTQGVLDTYRITDPPEMDRVLVAVDPAASDPNNRVAQDEPNENGVCVVGRAGQDGYLLEDASAIGSPNEWARRALQMQKAHDAEAIVVEVNQGGALVANTIRSLDANAEIIEVRATKGKHVRAAPISSLYEQGRIRHIGQFAELENQMTQMTSNGFEGDGSPDRVDALVWGFTELFEDLIETPPDASKFHRRRRAKGWMGR